MSWRPEGWNQGGGYQDEVNGEFLWNFMCDAYEAGADAYEAALKERGKKVIVTDTVRDNLYGTDRVVSEKVQTGWQVFIPEEEP